MDWPDLNSVKAHCVLRALMEAHCAARGLTGKAEWGNKGLPEHVQNRAGYSWTTTPTQPSIHSVTPYQYNILYQRREALIRYTKGHATISLWKKHFINFDPTCWTLITINCDMRRTDQSGRTSLLWVDGVSDKPGLIKLLLLYNTTGTSVWFIIKTYITSTSV